MSDTAKIIIAAGQIAQAIAAVGIPAVQKIIDQFATNKEPSLVELEAIGSTMVEPNKFFEED